VNKSLYDRTIEFPKEKRDHLRMCSQKVKNADKTSEGYKRNQELQKQHRITYQQLKRIKNFFDNFKGNQHDHSYILNGGVEMRNWVNNELRRMRDYIENTKHNKSEHGGMENQHIKSHEKNGGEVRPSQKHKSTLQKYDTAVVESLKRINELISKI
jgi:hypothetical protein